MKHIKIFENFASNEGFDKWKEALTLYKDDAKKITPAQDKEFDNIFKGSKITARFIFRSISAKTQALYDKDCKDFGKAKVDGLVDTVLGVFKLTESADDDKTHCSSCDALVDIDETDSYGRCERCQNEYGEIK